jgi:hypothetical protein
MLNVGFVNTEVYRYFVNFGVVKGVHVLVSSFTVHSYLVQKLGKIGF